MAGELQSTQRNELYAQSNAFPELGALEAQAITTENILTVLWPIWTEKPETASRVRQRIEAVLDYATAIEV